MTKIGDRVGAILSADDNEVKFLGYGIYDCDVIPPKSIVESYLFGAEIPNPRILLDNKEYVYGCQCWWGPEEKIREYLVGKKITEVLLINKEDEGKK